MTAHFDNSERNMHNPDPTKVIRQGSATYDEMMIGFVNYVVPKPPDRVIIKVDPKIFDAYTGQYEFDQTAVVTILKIRRQALYRGRWTASRAASDLGNNLCSGR